MRADHLRYSKINEWPNGICNKFRANGWIPITFPFRYSENLQFWMHKNQSKFKNYQEIQIDSQYWSERLKSEVNRRILIAWLAANSWKFSLKSNDSYSNNSLIDCQCIQMAPNLNYYSIGFYRERLTFPIGPNEPTRSLRIRIKWQSLLSQLVTANHQSSLTIFQKKFNTNEKEAKSLKQKNSSSATISANWHLSFQQRRH